MIVEILPGVQVRGNLSDGTPVTLSAVSSRVMKDAWKWTKVHNVGFGEGQRLARADAAKLFVPEITPEQLGQWLGAEQNKARQARAAARKAMDRLVQARAEARLNGTGAAKTVYEQFAKDEPAAKVVSPASPTAKVAARDLTVVKTREIPVAEIKGHKITRQRPKSLTFQVKELLADLKAGRARGLTVADSAEVPKVRRAVSRAAITLGWGDPKNPEAQSVETWVVRVAGGFEVVVHRLL